MKGRDFFLKTVWQSGSGNTQKVRKITPSGAGMRIFGAVRVAFSWEDKELQVSSSRC